MSMERRSFIQKTGIAGVLAAGAAPAVVNAQANVRWRLASSFPKSLDTIVGAADVFAKKVNDMTGGKFQISTHAAGELMPAMVISLTGYLMRPPSTQKPVAPRE